MPYLRKINEFINKIFDWEESPVSEKTKRIFWGILFFVTVILILTIDLIPNQIDLKIGQVSKGDISAPRSITFIDQEKTQELKEKAAKSAPRVYEEDINVNNKTKDYIMNFFNDIEDKKQIVQNILDNNVKSNIQTTVTKEDIVAELQQRYGEGITEKTILTFLGAPDKILNQSQKNAIEIMDRQFENRILPGDLPRVKEEIAQRAMELDLGKEYRLAIANILENFIRPNMVLNEEATKKRQIEAANQVNPVKRSVLQGEIIIRKGDVITEEDIKVLEALGLQKPQVNYFNIIGIILLVSIIIIMISIYFYKYRPQLWKDQKKILLLELMIIIILVIAKVIDIFQINYLSYLVPVAMVSILTTVLIKTDIAVIVTFFLSMLVALVFDNDFNIALLSFVGGLVGIYSVSKVSQRNDLVRAGFYVSGVLAILTFGLILVNPVGDWLMSIRYLIVAIMNGVLVAIFANGLLPYLENSFGLTSSVRLLELSNPSQPLLRRILVETPGTYHHSVIVGNLAESAADNIGADSLLARVGAYYHDIGKIKRPYFFSDNQFGGENPHDKISANLSSLIIKSHIKDGVELAKEYKLPRAIIDIIKQHHGTNLISYFYQQALEDSKHDSVEESDFRYDGPKPQTREAAIIMLADIVEAAVRSKQFNKNNHNRIEGLVRELIRDKLTEGQLDESDLTLRDLDTIANSFVKILTGIYHHRIEYPENLLKEMKRADRSDKSGDK